MAENILFDFFGTLVAYSPSRTTQGYESSFALLRDAGFTATYGEFLSLWSAVSAEFDKDAERSHQEFSMEEVVAAFLGRAIGSAPESFVSAFSGTYLAEWNKGVHYPAGVRDLLENLAARYTLAIVTNTHDQRLVPDHLARMGVSDLFQLVVTSVEYGKRKPAPEIFLHTVQTLGATPASCTYVGDNYEADYRGARGAGIPALLIDPLSEAPIPAAARLTSVLELGPRLSNTTR